MASEAIQQDASDTSISVDEAAQALMSRYNKPAQESKEETEPEVEEAEVQQESEEVTDEVEEPQESETADAEEESEETRFQSLNELAEATGMELDEFLKSIKAKTKVKGEENEVSLQELIKGYQLESDYTRKNEAFLNQQREWEQQRQQAQTELQRELQKTGYAFKLAQDQLTHDYNAIDWKQLQKDDPQSYLIQRQQFGERQAQIDHAINQATQHAQSVMDKQAQERSTSQQQYLQQQDELLLKALPEWSDNSVRKEESGKVADFLSEHGFTPDEVSNLSDHRLIVLAKKAMNGDKSVTSADLAKKKVKSVPKLVKPNARVSKSDAAAKKVERLKKKAFSTGRDEDIAAALLSRRL